MVIGCVCGRSSLQRLRMRWDWPLRFAICLPAPASGTRSSTGCSPTSAMNWRGRPLTSHEVVVELIAAVTTRSGLNVRAELDRDLYPTGVEGTDEQIAALSLRRHS